MQSSNTYIISVAPYLPEVITAGEKFQGYSSKKENTITRYTTSVDSSVKWHSISFHMHRYYAESIRKQGGGMFKGGSEEPIVHASFESSVADVHHAVADALLFLLEMVSEMVGCP